MNLLLVNLAPAVRGNAALDFPLPFLLPLLLLHAGPTGLVEGHFTAVAAPYYYMALVHVVQVDVGAAVDKGKSQIRHVVHSAEMTTTDEVRPGVYSQVLG